LSPEEERLNITWYFFGVHFQRNGGRYDYGRLHAVGAAATFQPSKLRPVRLLPAAQAKRQRF
jgi:hypothetical protein